MLYAAECVISGPSVQAAVESTHGEERKCLIVLALLILALFAIVAMNASHNKQGRADTMDMEGYTYEKGTLLAEKTAKRILNIYLIVFVIFILAINTMHPPLPMGEWDDYSLPVASILTDHNFEISADDVEAHKKIFPNWAAYIDSYVLTGFYTQAGEELTWYFPIYSIVCIPAVILLQLLHEPTEYAFTFTNIAVLMSALMFVSDYLRVRTGKKLIIVLMLSIHPILFYIGWPSAEVLIYSLLVVGLTCWYNKWFRCAAIAISLAGALNVTIMSVGIVMIFVYLIRLIIDRNRAMGVMDFIKTNIIQVIKYGSCYILGLIPLAYNYIYTGHINIQAGTGLLNSKDTVLSRFLSYLFDLNYGILPYFSILLLIGIALFIMALFIRHWGYVEIMSMFFLNTLIFSFMSHVNCGMTGIARYNAWSSSMLIFAVGIYFDEILTKKRLQRAAIASMSIGVGLSGSILLRYGLYMANHTSYVYMTPITQYVLDKAPMLYNPLHSTFNSRTNHIDGGYDYDTPIVYTAGDGYVRKILATSNDAEELLNNYVSSEYEDWFITEVESLTEKESYISAPKRYELERCVQYELGRPILFNANQFNAASYVLCGMSGPEEWGTWTDGNEVILKLCTESDEPLLHGTIDCSAFNGEQAVRIYVDEDCVFDGRVAEGPIQFDFSNPGKKQPIELKLELPEAVSPKELNQSEDFRKLSLAIRSITITDQ